MSSNLQIYKQVQLSNNKISKETKITLYKLLQKYDTIISKSSNDIGQTDLTEMHMATKLDAAQPYPLVLKHHYFLKHKIKNVLDVGIICKSMSPWTTPIVVVKKHTPEGLPQQSFLHVNYRKLNSLLLAVTPATGTMKDAFTIMPLLKIDELFALLKGAKYNT